MIFLGHEKNLARLPNGVLCVFLDIEVWLYTYLYAHAHIHHHTYITHTSHIHHTCITHTSHIHHTCTTQISMTFICSVFPGFVILIGEDLDVRKHTYIHSYPQCIHSYPQDTSTDTMIYNCTHMHTRPEMHTHTHTHRVLISLHSGVGGTASALYSRFRYASLPLYRPLPFSSHH